MSSVHRIALLTAAIVAVAAAVAAAASGRPDRAGASAATTTSRSSTAAHPAVAGSGRDRRFYREGPGSPAKPRHVNRRPAPKQPRLGRYVGPARNGASQCGYVSVGPGLEQAAAFGRRHVSCSTARKVAAAAKGHTNPQRKRQLRYRKLGFACAGSHRGGESLLRYQCRSGNHTISFSIR